MTVREALVKATVRLESRGVPNAGHDAAVLLGQVLGRPRLELPLSYSRPLTEAEMTAFDALIERRAGREPLQYILGTQVFMDFEVLVDRRVLIPRPETEVLAERAIALGRAILAGRRAGGAGERMDGNGAGLTVADVGTGSGCLAIAIARALAEARVTAIDSSPGALEVARLNVARLGLSGRVGLVLGDFLGPLILGGQVVDLVVSNPPYIPRADLAGLQEEVRDHEPRVALDGGPDGLDAYRVLAVEAPRVLAPGGWVALELGFGQAAEVRAMFEAAGFRPVEISPDLAGISRVMTARWAGPATSGERP